MPFAIFALAAVNIAIGTQSFVFAGLLSELAGDLGVSIGTAGLLVPASSITFAIAAPFAASLVSKIERKRVMVAGLVMLALCNALCAWAPSFGGLFALRVLGGVVTAFVGSLATIAVTSLVTPERRGRAFAIVVGGLTVALVLGVPIGSIVGGNFGWRTTFNYSALVCALSALLILFALPRIDPLPGPRASFGPLFRSGAILRVFGLTVLGFSSAFTIVAYLGPIINHLTGIAGAGVGALQVFIGVGSFLGLAAGGMAADRKAHQARLDRSLRCDGARYRRLFVGTQSAIEIGRAARRRGTDTCARFHHVRRRPIESGSAFAIGWACDAGSAGAQRIAGIARPGPWRRVGWSNK